MRMVRGPARIFRSSAAITRTELKRRSPSTAAFTMARVSESRKMPTYSNQSSSLASAEKERMAWMTTGSCSFCASSRGAIAFRAAAGSLPITGALPRCLRACTFSCGEPASKAARSAGMAWCRANPTSTSMASTRPAKPGSLTARVSSSKTVRLPPSCCSSAVCGASAAAMNASTSSGALHDAALNWLRRSFPAIIGARQLSTGVQIRLFIGQGRRRSHLRRHCRDDYIVPVSAELLYVALGDSTAIGVGAGAGGGYPERLVAKLRPAFPALKLLNLGESGATTSDLRETQLPRALRTRPRLVTLGIGINDVGLQIPDDAFALNLEETVVPLRKLGAPIAIANIPDLALAPAVARVVPRSFYERRIELFNEHITATAARHRLSLVDLYAWSREALPGRPELISPDGFHPSARGYDVWAERMLPAALALLRQSAPIFL